jgi:hypothetical protein
LLEWRRPLPASSSQTTKHTDGVVRYVCVRRKNGCSEGVGATLLMLALGWRSACTRLALGWRSAGARLALGWRSAGARLALGWRSAGAQLALGWRSAGARLALGWRSAGARLALVGRRPSLYHGSTSAVLEYKLPLSAHFKSRLVTLRALMLPRTRRRRLACAFVVPLSRSPRDFVVFTKTVFLLARPKVKRK